jgi:hypothetical protein
MFIAIVRNFNKKGFLFSTKIVKARARTIENDEEFPGSSTFGMMTDAK